MTMFLTIWSAGTLAAALMHIITYLDDPKRRVRK